MKKIIIIALLITASINAQIKGNKNIETRTFSIVNVEQIKVNLYAKITIDYAAKEMMTITADSNLFDNIDTEVLEGKLHLNQLKWIQPSQKINITIGAPNLRRVETGTHETLQLINVDSDHLNVMAPIGHVIVSGNVKQFNIGIENGKIDASKLIAENVRANIWGNGKAKVYAENEIYSIIKNDGRLILVNTPKLLKGDTKKALAETKKIENTKVNWIRFKIKNNSSNRNNFIVVGPKSDGSKFGYGFPMMPFSIRKENWSVGTKVYKVNKLGLRKLLVKIKPEDEGKTVKLF